MCIAASLMEHVAHQCICMQYILELVSVCFEPIFSTNSVL